MQQDGALTRIVEHAVRQRSLDVVLIHNTTELTLDFLHGQQADHDEHQQ